MERREARQGTTREDLKFLLQLMRDRLSAQISKLYSLLLGIVEQWDREKRAMVLAEA